MIVSVEDPPEKIDIKRLLILLLMASFYFPEDVFHHIKSFTKPNIWKCDFCECEEDMKVEMPKMIKTIGSKHIYYCESCVTHCLCTECEECSYDHHECEGCDEKVCGECIKQCDECGIDFCGLCFDSDESICSQCGEE